MVNIERGVIGDVVREVPEFRIKYKDVFSLQNLYVMMHELLLEEGWLGFEGVEDNEGHTDLETLYSENVFQKGIHSGGKEIWVWWRAKKNYEGRASQYFLLTLDLDWHVVLSQEREILHQGKKMKTQWGELEMFFKPRIISDLGHKWEHNWFLKHVKHTYEHRLMESYIEKMQKDLWRDVYRIQSKVKAYLNLKTWMPTPEPFHPKLTGYEEQF
ncbi:MAG: hypothetical protein QF798_04015 [Candidatus Woesearchaeota archaeon]|jgi:hypothetical protein|nr:hypothetical protein [archaeon]MDP6600575.1 hypothetical protein [Candidatus Woesearchaeota archaeon]MDP7263849.1 hypothetical protein [Candidatus Woesearchaeota archaeon]HJN56561.1 hypothetical protein [Candidatus Woesearchaeota archaeon]|tara:strand:- start:419 stop:1060 length:642 start_codon:yes stop_codon:yes gene_type:complete